jgi:hypothetical protein
LWLVAVDQLGEPPVVPPVPGVLAEPVQELLEGLLAGVEVVDERALEHVVHLAEVALVRHAVRGATYEPEDDATGLPAVGALDEVGLVGTDGAAHLPPRADPLEAGAGQPASLPLVALEGAGVDLLDLQSAGGAHRPRLGLGPGEEDLRAAVGHVVGELALDDVDEEHPARRAVVDAAPGVDVAVRVADHDVLAHQQTALGDLHQDVVDRGAGPTAAVPLVGAEQVGEPGDVEPVSRVGGADRPPPRQAGHLAQHLVGVALEPVVVGDHEPRLCRTR